MHERNFEQPIVAVSDDNIAFDTKDGQNHTQPDEPVTPPTEEYKLHRSGQTIETLLQNFQAERMALPHVVASAVPLINLAHAVRYMPDAPEGVALRNTIIAAVTRYAHDLETARIGSDHAQAAHYIICATIDDVVLNTPWGLQTGWAQSGLVSTFHMSVTGGERVFELLETFRADYKTNRDLLLLIYFCLSLAFEGRTRIAADGPLQLARIRQNLYKILSHQHSSNRRDLSPHWRGETAPYKRKRSNMMVYSAMSCLMLAFACGFLLFSYLFDQASYKLRAGLAEHTTGEIASIVISKPAPQSLPSTPAVHPASRVADLSNARRIADFRAFLKPDIDHKRLSLNDTNGQLIIRINNSGLFATGRTEVGQQFRALLQRIGGALTAENLNAVVVGYTDNVPIRTAEFPSNEQLSTARARAVGNIIASFTGTAAIKTEGRGERDPLADNRTAKGRQTNRRIEILVLTENTNSNATDAAPGLKSGLSR